MGLHLALLECMWDPHVNTNGCGELKKALVSTMLLHILCNNDDRIKVMFLPPYITSVIHPIDQDIIFSCKKHYNYEEDAV